MLRLVRLADRLWFAREPATAVSTAAPLPVAADLHYIKVNGKGTTPFSPTPFSPKNAKRYSTIGMEF